MEELAGASGAARRLGQLRLSRGAIGIMEKKMETTILYIIGVILG